MINTSTKNLIRNTNIPFLDVLRGLAALFVVFYHAQDVIVTETPRLASNIFYHVLKFGNLGVELFFVISGYCILAAALNGIERGKNLGDFALARVRRIFPAYWISLVATLLVAVLTSFLVHKGVIAASQSAEKLPMYLSLPVLATNATLTQVVTHQPFISIVAWTLCYELAFYLIAMVLMLATGKTKKPTLNLLRGVHLVTMAVLLVQIVLPGKLRYPLDMWAMFGLGAAVFHWVRAERSAPEERAEGRNWLIGLTILTLGAIFRGQGSTLSIMNHPAPVGFAVALLGVGVLWAVRNVSRQSTGKIGQVIGILGGYSYSLYLIHFLCIGMANQVFHKAKLPESWHYLHLAIMVAVSLAAGFVFFLIAEKPFLKMNVRKPAEAGLTPASEVAP